MSKKAKKKKESVVFDVSEADLKKLILANILRHLKQTNIFPLVGFPPGSGFSESKAECARESLIKEFTRRTNGLKDKTFYPEGTFKRLK